MNPGHISAFQTYSEFQSVREFNASNKRFLNDYGHRFTKGERLAFHQLTRFSVKVIGVCNARICKLVAACHQMGGISRSTVERMLRKARKLGILSSLHTIRKRGGYAHNVFIFHYYDGTTPPYMTEREECDIPTEQREEAPATPPETLRPETKELYTKTIRKETVVPSPVLDYSYLPTYIPREFINAVRSFFTSATEICHLWQTARMAYKKLDFLSTPIEHLVPSIIQSFKVSVYQYKRGKIRQSFAQYFYGALYGVLIVDKRQEVAYENKGYNWLDATPTPRHDYEWQAFLGLQKKDYNWLEDDGASC
ncbi:hypothetical protein A374_15177 [Fictibacillus macauensis ZFHKF-1]|uniref:Helix-turn-helix domain-containing protein n=1 Tax=Fictibacillus macauensis ZFHKF-1 TaxID=1196324 RepID=I8AGH1_9BACL|nr:hypothetical protein [Fictibacillus macauensis]EIT84479.1 hypothetical protein A374_15177 [Fictibacillus macauensis ZFHKF-1]